MVLLPIILSGNSSSLSTGKALFEKALTQIKAKAWAEALELLKQAQAQAESTPELFHALGLCLQNLAQAEAAEKAYRQALSLTPDAIESLNNLAWLLRNTAPEEALSLCCQALTLTPIDSEAALALLPLQAELLLKLNPQGLYPVWKNWLAHPQARPEDWLAGAQQALKIGAPEKAFELLEAGLNRFPWEMELRLTLLGLYETYARYTPLIQKSLEGLRALPEWQKGDQAQLYAFLARAYQAIGEEAQAQWALQEAQKRKPSDALKLEALLMLPLLYQNSAQAQTARVRFISQLESLKNGPPLCIAEPFRELKTAPFYPAFQAELNRAPFEKLAEIYTRFLPSFQPEFVKGSGRIKIGFVSHFFYEHSVLHLFEALISGLDPCRFEVAVFLIAPAIQDARTQHLADRVENFFSLSGSLAQSLRELAAWQAEALIYTDLGSDPFSWCLAHYRLAPIQIVLPGIMQTTGIKSLDYYLSPEVMEPPDAEAHYTETLIRTQALPVMPRKPKRSSPLLSRAELGLPADRRIYLCPMTPFKFHPLFDQILAGILKQDPQALIWVLMHRQDGICQKLAGRWKKSLASFDAQLHFAPWQPPSQFLHLLEQVDVVLDSWPVGGGNTVFTCLGLGIPIVSWASPWFRGRVALGAYRLMKIAGPVAETPEETIQLALKLAQDSVWREALKSEILAKNQILFENPESLREFSDFVTEKVIAWRKTV
ncbi:hypothetical protein COW36_19350 [bacterium (Candidatus Blackallbacteria) CG17_big_fil_post_rev_8_21_14_2_50_48_46]|uniref:protein O-GlcNAc transferase n=1 Tax=bacterium (Candidatus Blackallbacteria) CG17_big_fil_post_rev_8_21_14_2_50_48_46 TaxID=2014261 RepID=A0A2M7G083_9BACT|nr:MAG: hypothetical protein COW64_25120 [bacterium (Candidatus Blackallbacteria) CG18_big_fil_WC_8_21_14_2_50_49_26]PIW15080.1 MAG: hypothetical protein COW36_19350 [bacterium (Candidatus Blackallbacteria) CG17_big_fil_post_rev_8_21_14_2_50_48_46]PIW47597.1 MAG: hypothetical protein COW20_11970 [bacterium (Candidatus Blackallbacteria) CG13_big_fil_rev_8_21_14_2_50_49_14]